MVLVEISAKNGYLNPILEKFPRFDTILQCDGQTNGQTDGHAVAYTALAKLALRCAVKIKSNIIDTVAGRVESLSRSPIHSGRLCRSVQHAINSVYVRIGVSPEPAVRKPGSVGRRLVPLAHGDLCRTTTRISRRNARQSSLHAVF